MVVGRAGVGVDNVDTVTATRRGVMVVNAPGSNSLSTAEHAFALLLSQARNVPQANAALKGGKWERSKWEGVELHGKTLGVLGLGRIGTLVAQRGHAFGMRLIAWDPWMAPERARQLGVELLELEELFARADFVTIHVHKTKDTVGLVGKDLLAKAKPGLRIVNAARGGIVDEEALAQALETGNLGGAALDVFDAEPTTESPLFGFDDGRRHAPPGRRRRPRRRTRRARSSPSRSSSLSPASSFPSPSTWRRPRRRESVRPYLPLAERLGGLFAQLSDGISPLLEIEYEGELAAGDTRILTLSLLKGFFAAGSEEPVSYVNAPQFAEARGMEVRETKSTTTHEYLNVVKVRGGGHGIAGSLFGLRGEPRIVMIDGHDVELPLAANLLVVRTTTASG